MAEDIPCVCGHEQDDHLARLSIPSNRYGPCRAMADKWHRCDCAEYEGVAWSNSPKGGCQ